MILCLMEAVNNGDKQMPGLFSDDKKAGSILNTAGS